ncbi:LysR family transcriptional regulator [Arenibaculum pallidiluteum]|uniref:LysR family transcriptional regulator n=1 Tax=Arenibaculum pallidiluteum TaxID=2812559 RepID=UPI001A9689E5|nr:LysR family transcriptional regulator [Arenibaculum pallidiluteum]
MSEPFSNLAWDDFRLVKAIADAKSLPGAAERLGVNHSTVFRRLGQIEQAIGTPLFERHRSGYVPSGAGEEMVALAARLEEGITDFARRLAGRDFAPTGELRVTTNDSFLVHLLTPAFARFRDRFPGLRLDVVLSNQALNLSRRDADVAIRATASPPETLVGRRVASIAWALYGRAADFPDPTAPPDAAALAERCWVSPGDALGLSKLVRHHRATAPAEKVVYRVDSVLGLAEAVESGIGIGHLPCFIADARPSMVRLAAPDPALAADLWLLTHPDLRHAPRVRALMDFLADEIGRQRHFIAGERPLR